MSFNKVCLNTKEFLSFCFNDLCFVGCVFLFIEKKAHGFTMVLPLLLRKERKRALQLDPS